MDRVKNTVEDTAQHKLWVKGITENATMIWVSESHVELVVHSGLYLKEGQIAAVVVRGFLSMPVRVELQTGRHLVLRFTQRPHPTVVELLSKELLEAGIAEARDALEENAKPFSGVGDLEAWDDEAAAATLLQGVVDRYQAEAEAA